MSIRFWNLAKRAALGGAAAICAVVCAANVCGQEPAATDDAEIAFRYWNAPADALERWPWGEEKYYPVKISVFEDWLKTARREPTPESEFVISELDLKAQLSGNILDGFGTMKLAPAPGRESTPGTESAPFPMDALSFALLSIFERNKDGDAVLDGARVGLYPDSRLYLANPKAAEYFFRWARRGTFDGAGVATFNLSFPASFRTTLHLETPPDATLTSSQGVVSRGETAPSGARVWTVYLGGKSSTRLTLVRSATGEERRAEVGCRQELEYRVSEEGAEVVSRFFFERSDATIDEATVLLDGTLEPVAVEWGGVGSQDLVVSRTTELGSTKIKVVPPKRAAGEGLGELKITAFYKPELKIARRLPTIRLASENFRWRETLCRLVAVHPIVATETTPIDAAQAGDSLRIAQKDERFQLFKYFEPNAGVVAKFQKL
ncbi:MAG: hypothetical protein HUK22_07185, partial [Thermoguttaceae bacterium]|nr:hypothetical protein [Thermoguttaceae bacterium]